jgi:hypothetical protein
LAGPDRRVSRVSETVPATVDAHGELVVPADADLSTAAFVDATSALPGVLGPSDAANRALLARALRDWERWTGRPISEWSSSEHSDGIGRYGLTDPS